MIDKVKALFVLIRPFQWIKNILLFLPLFFAQEIDNTDQLQRVGFLFLIFCLLSSGVYLFNDWIDRKEDRLHPIKRHRPLAAGTVSAKEALLCMIGLWSVGCTLTTLPLFGQSICWKNPIFLLALGYIVLNLLYTLILKHISIIDVLVIACGFIIRLEAGAYAGQIQLSHWLIIMTFILSLFLAFAKRLDDLRNYLQTGQITRRNITGYTVEYLNVILACLSAIITVTYISYTLDADVMARSSHSLYLTVPFVLAGVFRYLQIILVEKSNCNPTDILWKDHTLQLTILGWFIVFALLIY